VLWLILAFRRRASLWCAQRSDKLHFTGADKMMKIKTMTVTSNWPDRNSSRSDLFRVEVITDSVEYAPHQMLTKAQVNELCDSKYWKVTIKPFPEAQR
jgi:hypothetical protein